MEKYEIPDKLFDQIASMEDVGELEVIAKKYRNARYGPDVTLAVQDRLQYLRYQASNNG